MDTVLFSDIVSTYPPTLPMSTNTILRLYNEQALMPITYRDVIQAFSQSPQLHQQYLDSKEQRQRKLEIALKDAEDTLYQKAQEGDIRAIEFLLKNRNQQYKEQKEFKITLSNNDDYIKSIKERRNQLENIIDAEDI